MPLSKDCEKRAAQLNNLRHGRKFGNSEELARSAQAKSVEARKANKGVRALLNAWREADTGEESVIFPGEPKTNEEAVTLALLEKIKQGNLEAIKYYCKLIGEDVEAPVILKSQEEHVFRFYDLDEV